ncbi:MAG: hypothetical protein P8I31_02895 [Bacteroidia bacterium]|nr:hypothetical protein [Flavobacteriaceae bacterium]MDG1720180.1 hypothetical protein [Bacteroidia bacterium]
MNKKHLKGTIFEDYPLLFWLLLFGSNLYVLLTTCISVFVPENTLLVADAEFVNFLGVDLSLLYYNPKLSLFLPFSLIFVVFQHRFNFNPKSTFVVIIKSGIYKIYIYTMLVLTFWIFLNKSADDYVLDNVPHYITSIGLYFTYLTTILLFVRNIELRAKEI